MLILLAEAQVSFFKYHSLQNSSNCNFLGFSDGSYESSPNRSPHGYDVQEKLNQYQGQEQPVEDKPLSLVIRKSLVDGDEDKPEYTVHNKVNEEYYGDGDSGNDDSEHPLVISEEDKDQDAPHDFSNAAARADQADTEKTDTESQSRSSGIKIKSFAKIFETAPAAGNSSTVEDPNISGFATKQSSTTPDHPDMISDLSSECSADDASEGVPYTYGTELEMTRVTKTSNGESLYQCGFCDKLFANKYHLQSHLVTHTGERAFNCKVCNKTFGRKSTLRAHMTTHTKVSNFMCGVCEKACNDNNSLEEHMRMHTGKKLTLFN